MNIEQVKKQINNSVEWLNNKDQNWLSKINLEEFDLTTNCILDQVFGDYEVVMDIYYKELSEKINPDTYQFFGNDEIEQLWVEKIKELRGDLIPG